MKYYTPTVSGRWSIEINRLLPSRTGLKIVGTGYIVVDISNSTFSGSFIYTEMINKKQMEVNALIVGGMYFAKSRTQTFSGALRTAAGSLTTRVSS